MASETTFDYWKVVYSWGKVRKTQFSQKPLNSRFWALGFLIYTFSCAKYKKIHRDIFNESHSMFLPLVRDHRTINIVCCSGHSSIWCWQSPLKCWGQSLSCLKQRSDFYFLWEKNSFNSDELAIKLLRSLAHGLKRDEIQITFQRIAGLPRLSKISDESFKYAWEINKLDSAAQIV